MHTVEHKASLVRDNGSNILDYSYLNNITPYPNDYKESLDITCIDAEVCKLESEMNSISLESIPFTKSDFVIVFIAGLLGGLCDAVLGKPADGYNGVLQKAHEPKIDNGFALGLGKHLKKFDILNNPIDKTIPGIPVGDHRVFSYGHDLLRFFGTASMLLSGTGPIGVSGLGGVVTLEQAPNGWIEAISALKMQPGDPKSYIKACIILALHLYKDYCSARSLPIPGISYLATLNGNKLPEFAEHITNDMEFNLRTLNGQILSVTVIELMVSIYSAITTRSKHLKEEYSKEEIKNKKDKMLLMAHSIALLFNLGKVCVTENPAFINFPQIIRIVRLAWKCVAHEANVKHFSIQKVNMGAIKNQMETIDTMILLDKSIYYTKQIDRFIGDSIESFDLTNETRNEKLAQGFDETDEMLKQLSAING